MIGALWALASGVGFGVFQSFNRRAVQGMDVFVTTFLQLLVSAVVLLAMSLLIVPRATFALLTGSAVLNFALAGALHFFIGWTFLNASQKAIGAARTSSLIGTIPIFGAVFAIFTLGEVPTALGTVGIFTIVAGVYLVNDAKIHKGEGGGGGSGESVPVSAVVEGKATGLRSLRFGLAAALCDRPRLHSRGPLRRRPL